MNARTFLKTCKSLVRAERACIDHFTEIMCQEDPSRQDVERSARLVEELGKIHSDAMNGFALHAGMPKAREIAVLLKHSATTLTESLLILDEIATRPHIHS
jgi:hypothetical protein